MIYLVNPTSETARAAIRAGRLGFIDTPAQRASVGQRVTDSPWCADNGAFSDKWAPDVWWQFLVRRADDAPTCLFATLPDVVGDYEATLARSMPYATRVRQLGYPAALVVQNGADDSNVPLDEVDAVFLGGVPECSTCGFRLLPPARLRDHPTCPDDGTRLLEWKEGTAAARIAGAAKARGLHVHMGRVNSWRRMSRALAIGCDSVDGTFLTRAPDHNLPRLLRWLDKGRDLGGQSDLLDAVGLDTP